MNGTITICRLLAIDYGSFFFLCYSVCVCVCVCLPFRDATYVNRDIIVSVDRMMIVSVATWQ